ncbi:MAG: methyltransferase domain-containing protein [Blastochloris sp.]|nr:methyltransferase domain-containing protein [Blastochloris sp.]
MKKPEQRAGKELYQHYRAMSCARLWQEEVPRYAKATERERLDQVSLLRALGVVFAESGTEEEKRDLRAWLRDLLQDPQEKVRRYAMNALPKLGAGTEEEVALLSVLKKSDNSREKTYLSRSLDKIGGQATLDLIERDGVLGRHTEQKVRAALARGESATRLRLEVPLEFSSSERLRIHLRCRKGLEIILREEWEERLGEERFRVLDLQPGLLALTPLRAFTLGDLYTLRCHASAGFVLGSVPQEAGVEELAGVVVSPLSQKLFHTFTEGPIRYRFSYIRGEPARGLVQSVVDQAFAWAPGLLNDARQAPWALEVYPRPKGWSLELRPRWSRDPRLHYRVQDVPAASHPPLAAAMARLAGACHGASVWDPFCGSGLELIECALRGGVSRLIGTDLSGEAIEAARSNLVAAGLAGLNYALHVADFRDVVSQGYLGPATLDVVISNPPWGGGFASWGCAIFTRTC